MKRVLLSVFSLTVACRLVSGADLGMTAPPLKIGAWIKGKPVDLAAGRGTNLYVVEFWATWCGPCKVSIPHLSELQKKFKDRGVVVVGVSNETADKVKAFVSNEKSPVMDYVVAVDDDEKTGDAYMKAFGIDGIPHAFVIDKQGRVAWQGHPMDGLEQTIEDLVEDRYDIEAAKRAFGAEKSMPDYFEQASQAAEPLAARALGERIVKDASGSPLLLNLLAWNVLTDPRIKHRDLELAMRAARLAYEKTDGKDASITDTYARAFFEAGKVKEAIHYEEKAVAVATDTSEREQYESTLKEYRAKLP